ncbi:unnamed protein product [Symbiodinium sp. CCMP2592]|nr:unnamed protein product [Symbiodinium sp. CCMP2592]
MSSFLHNALNTFKSCHFLGVAIGMNEYGHHHVTVHPWEPWWDEVFSRFGFEVDSELTALSRQPEYGTEERRGHTWWSGGANNHAPGKILKNVMLANDADPITYYQQIDWTQRVPGVR